jgi:hypothetical protein
LADHFAARAIGTKHLIEKAKEGPADAKDPLSAVGAFVGLGQELRGQQWAQEMIEVEKTLLAEVLDALAQGSQARPPSRKEEGVHDKYIYLSTLDRQLKMTP